MLTSTPLKPLITVLLLSLFFCTSSSRDVITREQPLKDGDVLESIGRRFCLGFFSPGNSSNRYLGIWYLNISQRTVIWVANRDHPIRNKSGVFSINREGNLVLYNNNQGTLVWSTNSTPSVSNVRAQLLDSGNLVLVGDSGKENLWQSFDHPANTFLPQMTLGLDRRKKLNRFLTSWKTMDDPGTGNFSLSFDTTGYPQLFLYTNKGMKIMWRAGSWNGFKWTGAPQTHMYNSNFTNNKDQVTVKWDNDQDYTFSRLTLESWGSVVEYTWDHHGNRWIESYTSPNQQCDYYQHCGAYGYCRPYSSGEFECKCLPGYQRKSPKAWNHRDGANGCVRERNVGFCGRDSGFLNVPNVKIPDTSGAVADFSVKSSKECEKKCFKNCSCTAYAMADLRVQAGCIIWLGELKDTREYYPGGGQDLHIRVDAIELAKHARKLRGNSKKVMLIVLSAISVTIISFAIFTLYWMLMKRKKKAKRQQLEWLNDHSNSQSFELSSSGRKLESSDGSRDVTFFDLKTISSATNNFSVANKLGQGGFGSVYKGQLANGMEIAVKRLSKRSGQGVEEFKNEVILIANLQHRNLVRLLGCCIDKDEKSLIYEHLPNKSLDFFLFDKARSSILDWKKRFEIIFGVARGVLYLHEDSRLKIVHRDLKASNVLLDAAMHPKISDFGMARIFGENQQEASTKRIVGTYGYMSPEYAMEGLYSAKSDVFSFGVLILEIICGRRNTSYDEKSPSLNLIGHVWQLWREGKALEIVDPSLGMIYSTHEVLRCIHVGLLCVEESVEDRPTMLEVVFMLGNDTSLPSPNRPAFILRRTHSSGSKSSSSAKAGSSFEASSSTNDLTITRLEPR